MKTSLALITRALLAIIGAGFFFQNYAAASTLTVNAGQPVTIAVTADGTQPFTYQWRKNGTAISGATGATYVIAAASTADSATYSAVVTNSVNYTVSDGAVLTVNAVVVVAPTITTQPASLTVTAGQSASFSVTATGSSTLSYQWMKNSVAISGATNATYAIPTTSASSAGNYSVVVTNSGVSTTSNVAILTVNAAVVAPTVTTQPASLTVTAGQPASFSVAASGSTPLTYQWLKNSTAISGATSATYAIPATTAADAANYSVVVTNSAGTATSNFASLTVSAVVVAPAITTQPASLTVTAGQPAAFSVTASSSVPLTYQWRKNSTAISGATNATYSIPATTAADAANYSVVVTNSAGTATSSNATLTVNAAGSAPAISTQPASLTVTVGQSATLAVLATGSGTLTYQWTKGGTAISGATSASYSLTSATSADAGSYAVIVSNTYGPTTSSTATLTVTQETSAFKPDASAASSTGGAAGSTVTVSTAANFKTYAESPTAYVINISGTIDLGGSVSVKSNKTIQGVDGTSTIIGALDLSSGGVSNVIIRGLNITNPTATNGGGVGIVVRNASNIFITHCTLFDCAGDLIEISNGADLVTVSWSEFYFATAHTGQRSSMRIGLTGSETKPLRVTLHHNWWSDRCDTNMPSSTYGYVHLFNNYFKASGSTSTTDARDNAQFLAEFNAYEQMNNPLSKQNVDTAKPAGRIRAISNLFTNCTGKAVDVGTDAVSTPAYSYELLPAEDVAIYSTQFAGNTAGASSGTPSTRSASITGPAAAVVPGASFVLTAVPASFTGTSYQWRLNNFNISGATSSTYSVASMQAAHVGTYSVVIGTASGDYVVASPLAVSLGSSTSGDTGGSGSSSGGTTAATTSSGGGGGGAPGLGYLAALLLLSALRQFAHRSARKN